MTTIMHDNRPSYYFHSLFALHAYDIELSIAQKFEDLPNWQIAELPVEVGGFKCVLWMNEQNRQYIVSYRGTDNLAGVMEDIHGIVLNGVSPQKEQAYLMAQKAAKLAKDKNYSLGFTGHSLGAFLAELSVFFCQNDFDFPHAHAVTFESPGSLDALEKLSPGISAFQSLDIVQFLSYPNPINTFCRSIGTLYQVTPQLSNWSWVPGYRLQAIHSMQAIVDALREVNYCAHITKWPSNAGRFHLFFSHTDWKDNRYDINSLTLPLSDLNEIEVKARFQLKYRGNYSVTEYLWDKELPLDKHFQPALAEFLTLFYQHFWGMAQTNEQQNRIKNIWDKSDLAPEIKHILLQYKIVKRAGCHWIQIVDETLSIFDFREQLSKALEAHPKWIPILLKSTGAPLSINASVIAEGGILETGGIIEGAIAVGIKVEIPDDEDEEAQKRFKDLCIATLDSFEGKDIQVNTSIIGKGGIAKGTIRNGAAYGMLFTQSAKPSREHDKRPESTLGMKTGQG
ncbi:MAG: hypothetical protein CK424_02905 [Legionella sp.]|nr:MAG: hypothetical protein CK424_02905 [Legionella sp.]